MPIIWERPTRELIVQRLTPAYVEREQQAGEPLTDTILRLARITQQKVPDWAGLVPVLVTESQMPATKVQRYAWRLQGDRVVIDPSIPAPVNQRQVKLAAVLANPAVTQDLKDLLAELAK